MWLSDLHSWPTVTVLDFTIVVMDGEGLSIVCKILQETKDLNSVPKSFLQKNTSEDNCTEIQPHHLFQLLQDALIVVYHNFLLKLFLKKNYDL